MKLKIIACEIFRWMIEENPIEADIVYLDIAQHDYPEILHYKLQDEIDASMKYENILLFYGLCGNAIIDLHSTHSNLYVFRAHDCSTVLLGSPDQHINEIWSCFALHEKKKSNINHDFTLWKQQYGEEMAQYLSSMLHATKDIAYINFERKEDEMTLTKLENDGYHIHQMYPGTMHIVKQMLFQKDHPMILKVPIHEKIIGIYDFDRVISTKTMV